MNAYVEKIGMELSDGMLQLHGMLKIFVFNINLPDKPFSCDPISHGKLYLT